ncbi:MAG: hypothetical protein WC058_10795 [Phycisphaeraceae bacterium]
MKHIFRWGGVLVFIFATLFRLHARMILPHSFSWSGDFATSHWGVMLSGFGDITTVVALLSGLAFLLSFTNLLDDRQDP